MTTIAALAGRRRCEGDLRANSSSRALDRIVATHAQAHGLGGKAPITREAMEAGLRRNTIVRKASITQGDRVQLKGEERGAADVNKNSR